MDEFNIVKPPLFEVKKWIVIAMTALKIAMMIVYASLVGVFARKYLYDYEDMKPHQIEVTRTVLIITIVLLSVFSITFSLFGLIGAWKENLCLIITYAVLSIIELIATMANSIKRPYYWASTIWITFSTIVVILFMRDLFTIRRQKQNQFRAQATAFKA